MKTETENRSAQDKVLLLTYGGPMGLLGSVPIFEWPENPGDPQYVGFPGSGGSLDLVAESGTISVPLLGPVCHMVLNKLNTSWRCSIATWSFS